MAEKAGIIINRMYVGDYLSSNLGHEIINLFLADNRNHYLYLNSSGSFAKEHEGIDKMLLVRYEGDNSLEVIGMARGLKLAPDVTKPRIADSTEKDGRILESQKNYIERERINYGGVSILDIFNQAEQQSVFITFKADEVKVPKEHIRIFLHYGDIPSYVDDPHTKIVTLKQHNLPKTSLKSYIYPKPDIPSYDQDYDRITTEIIENSSLWNNSGVKRVENNSIFLPKPVSIFDICQLQNDENRFSYALAYFMNHPYYRSLWIEFFNRKGIELGERFTVKREVDALIPEVKEKTGGRIDLFIEDDNNIIVIENKIKSDINTKPSDKIGESQLSRYKEFVTYYDIQNKKTHWFFILAPDYNNPHISDKMSMFYNYLKYSEIYDFLNHSEFKGLVEKDSNFIAFRDVMFRHTLSNPNGYLYYEMLEKFYNRIRVLENNK